MEIQFLPSVRSEMEVLQRWSASPAVHRWVSVDNWYAYFDAVSRLEKYYLYSVHADRRFCAHIAAENTDGYMAVSIVVEPALHGRGIGQAVIRAMLARSQDLFGNIRGYKAHIFAGNEASRVCFTKCGFTQTESLADGESVFVYDL